MILLRWKNKGKLSTPLTLCLSNSLGGFSIRRLGNPLQSWSGAQELSRHKLLIQFNEEKDVTLPSLSWGKPENGRPKRTEMLGTSSGSETTPLQNPGSDQTITNKIDHFHKTGGRVRVGHDRTLTVLSVFLDRLPVPGLLGHRGAWKDAQGVTDIKWFSPENHFVL